MEIIRSLFSLEPMSEGDALHVKQRFKATGSLGSLVPCCLILIVLTYDRMF